ncbi:hypothetical protein C7999DRAFT_33378 [Corynascus novoguineensis]|uniref:Uncharacterized protein n=1 Tax=Corynascus novoguineensis TaxID=1126955 RepID=A0AAN7HNP0_9PEZI|nr:hypothetical protein C7999DRAFT_33378 [Corynascus novoguineensis]
MAVTAKSVKAQSLMSTAIREHVARKMIVENQKSMGILLELLVFLGWPHSHRKKRLHLTLMGSLAMSLIYDLCLDKSPTPPSFGFSLCKGDRVLVALVNVQLVVDQVTATTSQSHAGEQIPAIPFYLESLQARLQAISNEVPAGLANHDLLPASIIHAELLLNKARLLHIGGHHSTNATTNNLTLPRHALLNATLAAASGWLDMLLATPPHRHSDAPFLLWVKTGDALTMLLRLVTREDPAWRTAMSAAQGGSPLNPAHVCSRLAAIADAITDLWQRGEAADPNPDAVLLWIRGMVESMRTAWRAEVEAAGLLIDDSLSCSLDVLERPVEALTDRTERVGDGVGATVSGGESEGVGEMAAWSPWFMDVLEVPWD